MQRKYLITFSGGKDSLAIILWAKENLKWEEWDVVFCDTGWESVITYEYIDFIEKSIGKKFIRLKQARFENKLDQHIVDSVIRIFGERNVFAEMTLSKGRFPSTRARFCTEELKMKPIIDYILSLDYDVTVVQGVRAQESASRKMLRAKDEYFRFYFEPRRQDKNGKSVYDSYRSKEIKEWCNKHICDVDRPILYLTAIEVFERIFASGLKPNPLYFKGHSRVGCYPCIMCQLAEIKLIAENDPHRIEQLEQLSGSSFFPPDYIPRKYCTKLCSIRVYPESLAKLFGNQIKSKKRNGNVLFEAEIKDPNTALLPTISDVVKYVTTPGQQLLEVKETGCISFYNICEVVQ